MPEYCTSSSMTGEKRFIALTPGFYFYPEPVGIAAPKFSQETETLTFKRRAGAALVMLCLAQASPLPTFRLVSKVL
jgi:hypothetical protein